MNENRCVSCGEPIPEGRQVCFICEHQNHEDIGLMPNKTTQINETTIREIEDECINSINIWEYRNNSSMEKINIFNEGVRAMAQALIKRTK